MTSCDLTYNVLYYHRVCYNILLYIYIYIYIYYERWRWMNRRDITISEMLRQPARA